MEHRAWTVSRWLIATSPRLFAIPLEPASLLLAVAGLPDDLLDQVNTIGWFLPFLALVVPVGLIFSLAVARLGYVILGLAQLAAIIIGLRWFSPDIS